MAMFDETLQLYVSSLIGGVIIIHGTSSKEATAAQQLGDQLKCLNVVDPQCVPASLKELSAAIKKARHVVLLFNSLDNFMKKLRHVEEFVAQINHLRENAMLVVTKHSIVPDRSPLNNYMCLDVEDEPQKLARKCLTIFGAPKPIAGSSDAVLWHSQPTRVVLTRQHDMSSLGLSIITRQLHPTQSLLKRVTLIKEINHGGVASNHLLLKKYMHLQSINGISLDNMDIPSAAGIIQQTIGHKVQLMVRSARRDVVKAERIHQRASVTQMKAAESPMEVQTEEFTLLGSRQDGHERVISTPRVSAVSDDFVDLTGSGSNTPMSDNVFGRGIKQRPQELHSGAPFPVITGIKWRGKICDELKWQKKLCSDVLIGGGANLAINLTLVDFAQGEEYTHGVVIKDFKPGYKAVSGLLQVNDLIHSIEDVVLMDLNITKVKEVLDQARERNTEVTVRFYQMASINLDIQPGRVKKLLPQQCPMGRSDEGVCVEKSPLLSLTGNHYHNVMVLGDSLYGQEIMDVLCSSVETKVYNSVNESDSLLIQRYLDDGWQPIDKGVDTISSADLECEYVVTMINHKIIDLQFQPMNLLQHIFMKPSGVTILVIGLDSFLDDPYIEYTKMQSTLSLIHAHASPKGTHVIVVGVYERITEEEATTVADVISEVVRKSPATNNLIVNCGNSLMLMYKTKSADHRSIKAELQHKVQNCTKAFYKRLEHTSQHYIPRQWPVVRQGIMNLSRDRPIAPLKDLDQPIKEHCSMESDGKPYTELLRILQEYSPAFFFGKMDIQPQKHFLSDPTIIPKVLAQVLPTAVDKHSQFNKVDLELFTSSLIISRSHLRMVIMEELRDVTFDALLDWMIKLLVAYRITVDNNLGETVPANQSSKSEYIFFPILGQHASCGVLSKQLREEFAEDIWELYVHIREPISAAFYYEFLALLIQGSFECQSQSERVNCFRISNCGQLATVCFHAKNSPMYFKLMTEFHGLQRVIEIRMRKRTYFHFQSFNKFIAQILQEICHNPHWMHLRHSIMIGCKPSPTESIFRSIFHKLGTLSKHEVELPIVYQMEMTQVFDRKDPIDLRSPEAGTLAAREEDDQYAHGKKMDYPTFKVVSEILDSSGKWDLFADSLKLAGVFEISRMHRRYSMVSHGMELLSRALGQHSIEDITSTLSKLELNLAVDIIEKRVEYQ